MNCLIAKLFAVVCRNVHPIVNLYKINNSTRDKIPYYDANVNKDLIQGDYSSLIFTLHPIRNSLNRSA